MNDLKSLIEFITKFSIKDSGLHLTNIANLYAKPFCSYKKIINYRQDSYQFFILFIFYYSILIYFVVDNIRLVIPLTVLELILTIIPFLFLLPPFLFFRNKWQKKINSNRLFRLIFIIKIQYSVILFLLILSYNFLKIEGLFILIDNFLIVVVLAMFITFPFVLKISVLKKIVWAFTNYLCFLLFFLTVGLVTYMIPKNESENLLEKLIIPSPTVEYMLFEDKYNYSDYKIRDDYFIIITHLEGDKLLLRNTQYATKKLVSLLIDESIKDNNAKIKLLKSLKIEAATESQLVKSGYKKRVLQLAIMDSMKVEFNKYFLNDLNTIDTLIKNSKFKSNKNLFTLYNKRLKYYDSLYTKSNSIDQVLVLHPVIVVKADSNSFIFLYKYKGDSTNTELKKEIERIESDFEEREYYDSFLSKCILYPLDFLIDKFE